MKAGLIYEEQKKLEDALKIYERIQKDFFKSYEGRDIEKYISRVKSLLNK